MGNNSIYAELKQDPIIIWTLDQAVELVRSLHAKIVENKCTIALGGGCLHKGFSTKDVDIIIHPLDGKDRPVIFDFEPVKLMLEELGFTHVRHAKIEEYSDRNVEIWITKEGKRVDFFFLDA